MNIEMLNGNVLIAELKPEEITKSGVIIGEVRQELKKGEIKVIGFSENDLKTGDVVYFKDNGSEAIEIEGLGKVYVIRETNIEAMEE